MPWILLPSSCARIFDKDVIKFMYKSEEKRVSRKLRRMVKKGILQGKRIYLFGVSDNTRQVIKMLREYDLEPSGILDNDPVKRNSYCARIKVSSVEDFKAIEDERNIFLIYSFFWKEMFRQLEKLSVSRRNLCRLCKKKEPLFVQYGMAFEGRRIYKRILKKYGELPVFLCPYTGTGDIYLIGTFWKQYLQAADIQEYVFVVISNACKKAASIFPIRNIEVLKNQNEGEYLIKYYMLCPEKIQLKLLNDGWGQIHANPLQWFRGYRGLYFTEVFRKFVFNLPDTAIPEIPLLDHGDRRINRLFEELCLREGRTVILSPYANTLSDLPDDFWQMLAQKLKNKGYIVCTNSSGKSEPVVEGTIPVFCPLDIAPQFIEKAGYFIGVRSGFCDIISAAKAKKIILYDKDNRFFNSSAYEYFSLNHMGLCKDAIEIVFDHTRIYTYIEQIVGML